MPLFFPWPQGSSALLYLVEQYDQAKVRQATTVRQVAIDNLARARVLDFDGTLDRLDRAVELGVVDGNRVGIMGWSYGGFMTCWAVTQTNRFKAAVGGANISNWYTLYGCNDSHIYAEGLWSGPAFDEEEKVMQRSPIRHVRQVETPLLLLHGESDIRCPIGQSEQFFTALKRLGKSAVFIRYPGQFHGLAKPGYVLDRWLRTVAWFKYYLSGSN